MRRHSVYVTKEVFEELERLVAIREQHNPLLKCIPNDIIAILLNKYHDDIENNSHIKLKKEDHVRIYDDYEKKEAK